MFKTKYNNKKVVRYPNGRTKDYEELKEMAFYNSMDKKKKDKWREKLKEKCIIFDSIKECEYYEYLLELKSLNLISELKLQPIYVLQPKNKELGLSVITYKADFEFINMNGQKVTIDVKGMPSEVAKIKRKLFMYTHRDYELMWVCWATDKLGWMDYFENEKRKAVNRKLKKAKNS